MSDEFPNIYAAMGWAHGEGADDVADAAERELEQIVRERDLAREEIRLREASQIPVIPQGAQNKIAHLEARLAKVPALVEAAKGMLRLGSYQECPPDMRALNDHDLGRKTAALIEALADLERE